LADRVLRGRIDGEGSVVMTARDWKGACDGIDELDRGEWSAALSVRRAAVATFSSRGLVVRRSLRAEEVRSYDRRTGNGPPPS
jgi:hypothetical protein